MGMIPGSQWREVDFWNLKRILPSRFSKPRTLRQGKATWIWPAGAPSFSLYFPLMNTCDFSCSLLCPLMIVRFSFYGQKKFITFFFLWNFLFGFLRRILLAVSVDCAREIIRDRRANRVEFVGGDPLWQVLWVWELWACVACVCWSIELCMWGVGHVRIAFCLSITALGRAIGLQLLPSFVGIDQNWSFFNVRRLQ